MINRKVADCRQFPSEKNCSLTIAGTEEEVVKVAIVLNKQFVKRFFLIAVFPVGKQIFFGVQKIDEFSHKCRISQQKIFFCFSHLVSKCSSFVGGFICGNTIVAYS